MTAISQTSQISNVSKFTKSNFYETTLKPGIYENCNFNNCIINELDEYMFDNCAFMKCQSVRALQEPITSEPVSTVLVIEKITKNHEELKNSTKQTTETSETKKEDLCECGEHVKLENEIPKETQYRKTKATSLIGLLLAGMYKEYHNEVLFFMSNIPEFKNQNWKQIKEAIVKRDVSVIMYFTETNPWFECPDFEKASIEKIRADTAFAVFVKSIE